MNAIRQESLASPITRPMRVQLGRASHESSGAIPIPTSHKTGTLAAVWSKTNQPEPPDISLPEPPSSISDIHPSAASSRHAIPLAALYPKQVQETSLSCSMPPIPNAILVEQTVIPTTPRTPKKPVLPPLIDNLFLPPNVPETQPLPTPKNAKKRSRRSASPEQPVSTREDPKLETLQPTQIQSLIEQYQSPTEQSLETFLYMLANISSLSTDVNEWQKREIGIHLNNTGDVILSGVLPSKNKMYILLTNPADSISFRLPRITFGIQGKNDIEPRFSGIPTPGEEKYLQTIVLQLARLSLSTQQSTRDMQQIFLSAISAVSHAFITAQPAMPHYELENWPEISTHVSDNNTFFGFEANFFLDQQQNLQIDSFLTDIDRSDTDRNIFFTISPKGETTIRNIDRLALENFQNINDAMHHRTLILLTTLINSIPPTQTELSSESPFSSKTLHRLNEIIYRLETFLYAYSLSQNSHVFEEMPTLAHPATHPRRKPNPPLI